MRASESISSAIREQGHAPPENEKRPHESELRSPHAVGYATCTFQNYNVLEH